MSEWLRDAALVGVGGFFGAAGRFLLSGWIGAHSGQFPYGTLAVNVIGSLAIGFLVAGLAERVLAGAAVRLLVMAGFLGAFTTFSAFSYESVQLWNQGRWPALARQHRLERRRLPAGHLHRNGCGARPDPGPALVVSAAPARPSLPAGIRLAGVENRHAGGPCNPLAPFQNSISANVNSQASKSIPCLSC